MKQTKITPARPVGGKQDITEQAKAVTTPEKAPRQGSNQSSRDFNAAFNDHWAKEV